MFSYANRMIDFDLSILNARDRALFADLGEDQARRFHAYLISVPRVPGKRPSVRNGLTIGLYDPWCDRRRYPLGILWQLSPYSCCQHLCSYCFGQSYLRDFPGGGRRKRNFRRSFHRCLDRMEELDLPARHLSMANSSDVLQESLERKHRDTLHVLETLVDCRHRFSSFGILTKAPQVLLDGGYVRCLRHLEAEVQVSIAFFRDEMRTAVEPHAPEIATRMRAVEALVEAGVRVAVRIDPLFPRGIENCREYQGLKEDLLPLVEWARAAGVSYVIGKPLKLFAGTQDALGFKRSIRAAFTEERGSYLRMPRDLQKRLLDDMRELCRSRGIGFEHCFRNILKRNIRSHRRADELPHGSPLARRPIGQGRLFS